LSQNDRDVSVLLDNVLHLLKAFELLFSQSVLDEV
jgi:hypothetical protein